MFFDSALWGERAEPGTPALCCCNPSCWSNCTLYIHNHNPLTRRPLPLCLNGKDLTCSCSVSPYGQSVSYKSSFVLTFGEVVGYGGAILEPTTPVSCFLSQFLVSARAVSSSPTQPGPVYRSPQTTPFCPPSFPCPCRFSEFQSSYITIPCLPELFPSSKGQVSFKYFEPLFYLSRVCCSYCTLLGVCAFPVLLVFQLPLDTSLENIPS